jgi:hypothetical protein
MANPNMEAPSLLTFHNCTLSLNCLDTHEYRHLDWADPAKALERTPGDARKKHMNIETALKEVMTIEGALGAALVDYESGMSLGTIGGGRELDLEVAAASNTEVVRAKMRALATLKIEDSIEDILITLNRQYHIIRVLDRGVGFLFFYVALDRERSNLALARHNLKRIEREISV